MSKMTLEQVRDELHMYAIENTGEYNRVTRLRLQEFSNAIDAEIKTRGEPVAECPDGQFSSVVTWLKPLPPKGTKLYTAPPAPKIEATDAVLKRAVGMYEQACGGPYSRMAAALEAALKETP